MDGIIAEYLAGASMGKAVSEGAMTVFPIFAPQVSEEYEFLVMQEAMDRGILQITEINGGGSVPQLMAVNTGKLGILIIDGEQILGGRQDRTINTTIMLAPESKTVIPVSCTEHGRWRETSREFYSADHVTPHDLHTKKMRSVSESLKQKSSYESDQREVWDEVAHLNVRAGAQSATGAMGDSFTEKKQDIDTLLRAFSPQPHQRGLLVLLNEVVVGFEMISREDAFMKVYHKLIRSYGLDAVILEQRPAVHKNAISTAAKTFFSDIRNCTAESYPSVGLGTDYRFAGKGKIGSGLVVENVPVYLSFYTMEESSRQHSEGQMAGFQNRRAHAVRRNVVG